MEPEGLPKPDESTIYFKDINCSNCSSSSNVCESLEEYIYGSQAEEDKVINLLTRYQHAD